MTPPPPPDVAPIVIEQRSQAAPSLVASASTVWDKMTVKAEALKRLHKALELERDAERKAKEHTLSELYKARLSGASWEEIASVAGTTRQAAYQRWSDKE